MLLLRAHRRLWRIFLAADYPKTSLRPHRFQSYASGSIALPRRFHKSANKRLAFRSHARASLARRNTHFLLWGGAVTGSRFSRKHRAVGGDVHLDGRWLLRVPPGLLANSNSVLERVSRRCWHWHD